MTAISTRRSADDRAASSAFRAWGWPLALFALALLAFLRTVAPTFYLLDSSELATGAATLGIVHAPGYPLYLLVAHLFTLLPIGDVGFRVNLFSALCLSATAPILFDGLRRLTGERIMAAAVALMFVFSYYVWAAGVAAEVYASQIVTVALCLLLAARMVTEPDARGGLALAMGAAVGVAVAMHPSSALMAPAVALLYLGLGVSLRRSAAAAVIALVIFAASLLYFPLRAAANPALNLAGSYAADGSFQPANLSSLAGIVWFLRGGPFTHLFFDAGILPTLAELTDTLRLFWNNYLGLGLLAGLLGLGLLARRQRRGLLILLAALLPYSLFYAAYDVPDRQFMFGPALLLWTIPLAFGLSWCLRPVPNALKAGAFLLPLLFVVVNFPLLDLSHDFSAQTRAEQTLAALPPKAAVFGDWLTIVPAQYLQIVEARRPDLTLYNLFLFDSLPLSRYVVALLDQPDRPIVFLSNDGKADFPLDFLEPSAYKAVPVYSRDAVTDGRPIGYLLKPVKR